MTKARKAIPRVDKQVFKRTANKTKRVNLGMMHMRGGIRF